MGSQGLSSVALELPLLSRFREYLWAFRKENATHFPTSPNVNRDFAPMAFWAMTIPSGDFGDCRSRGLILFGEFLILLGEFSVTS